jgi:hypothetical protein
MLPSLVIRGGGIDADQALTRNHVGNHVAQVGLFFAARPVSAIRARQAADMGRENLAARASLHCPIACQMAALPGQRI